MAFFPVADFTPDQQNVPPVGSAAIYNVVPRSKLSYGPLASFQPFSSALAARCQGGLSVTALSGVVRVFAGDAAKLYRLTAASTTPIDVTRDAGSYTTSPEDKWSMAIFGNRVIATNYTDEIQSYVEGTSTKFANMITSGLTTLKAKVVAVVKDWVVLGNTNETTSGVQTQRVHWLAENDPTNAPIPGTQDAVNALSDFQDIPGSHGVLQNIVSNLGAAHAGIFFERSIQRMVYSGLPAIFEFQPVESGRGIIAQDAVCARGGIAYGISEEGFFAFDGASAVPIGKGRIDEFFFKDLIATYKNRIVSVPDPISGLIFFAYPGIGSFAGQLNRLLIYSPEYDKFTVTEPGAVILEHLLRAATFGKTLEDLDDFGTMESLAFSLDSPVWKGAQAVLGGFDSAHKFGYLNGSNLAATIDTADLEIIKGRVSTVSRIRPLIDVSSATVSGCGRRTLSEPASYGSDIAQESDGSVCIRTTGRYHKFRSKIPSEAVWKDFSGVCVEDEDVSDEGSR